MVPGDIFGLGHGHDIAAGHSVDEIAMVYEFEFQEAKPLNAA